MIYKTSNGLKASSSLLPSSGRSFALQDEIPFLFFDSNPRRDRGGERRLWPGDMSSLHRQVTRGQCCPAPPLPRVSHTCASFSLPLCRSWTFYIMSVKFISMFDDVNQLPLCLGSASGAPLWPQSALSGTWSSLFIKHVYNSHFLINTHALCVSRMRVEFFPGPVHPVDFLQTGVF